MTVIWEVQAKVALAEFERLRERLKAADELVTHFEDVLDALGFICGGDHELEGYGISEEEGAKIRKALANYRALKGDG